MNAETRAQTVMRIVDHALDLDSAARADYLRTACGSDPTLLDEVKHVLDGNAAAQRAFDLGARELRLVPPEIGPYRIVRLISEGGMGVVYEAEQQRPLRRVALKVIRSGFMNDSMLRRFEYEADILARLEHPGIARIYDAGVAETAHGAQPFFAMELVDGQRLDQYVARATPDLETRLTLLIRICEAVHHAHTRGVIHRDLKPANILIASDGSPKVLDFGVARVTDSDVHATTLHTESGALVGTLPYMAPEQAAGRVRELDTSSDVYALGVIAYELLTGRMPYSLKDKPLHDAVRVICEEEPSRLSSVDKSLRGDVETIVRKAMEKEQSRRYATAGELAADVKRYLDYEPVTARPPSRWYSFVKFARRNKVIVAAAALVIGALIGATAISVRFAIRAAADRRDAEARRKAAEEAGSVADAVGGFLSQMLASADPEQLMGENVTVLQATRAAVKQLDAGRLKDKPLVEAEVRSTIADTLRSLSRLDDAEPNALKVLELRRARLPPTHEKVVDALVNLATLRRDQGRLADSEMLLREAIDLDRRADPPRPLDAAYTLNNIGVVAQDRGRLDDAEAAFREAVQIRRSHLPTDDPLLAETLDNLARLLQAKRQYREAEQTFRSAIAILRKALPTDHPDLAICLNNLAELYHTEDRPADAEPLYREALEIFRKRMPANHPYIATSLDNLAGVVEAQGRDEEAERYYREALRIYETALPSDHPDTATSLGNLGRLILRRGDPAEAERLLRRALAIRRKAFGERAPATLRTARELAATLDALRRADEAGALRREYGLPGSEPATRP